MQMKKLLLSIIAIASSSVAMAQHPEAGTFSVIPRIGLSIASLPGDNIYVSATDLPLSSRYRTSFMGGVDFDYQFTRNLSVTLGAYYAQQGCNYKNNSVESVSGNGTIVGTGYSDWSTQLHYINVPLMLNAYIAPGVALKAGVQMGIAMSGKMKYTETEYTVDKNGELKSSAPEDYEYNLDKTMKKVCFAIPVGFSYEFSNVIVDARYNIGLTPFQKKIAGGEESKNRVFTVSVGYRFAL